MNPFKQFVNQLSTKSKTTPYLPYKSTLSTPNMSVAPKTTNMSVAPKKTVTPTGNQSATSPVVKKSTQTTLPQSGVNYVNQLSTTPAYDAVTGARTSYGASQGLPDMMGGKPVATPTAPTPQVDPYKKYLDSLFDPEKIKTAQGNIDQLNERTSKELLRTRAREDELRKNDIGQLERGQNYQLGEEQRLSNKSLADLAIAKGASVDTLNQILSAGKESYEMSQPIEVGGVLYQKGTDGQYTPLTDTSTKTEGFTLGKDQVRYDAQGNVIAGNTSGSGGGGNYVAGADPTADSWVKWVQAGGDITKVPDAYQNQVVQATAGTPKAQSEISKQVVSVIDQLLGRDTGAITGFQNPLNFLPGTAAQTTKNIYNQLKGLLSLDNIKYLKGTGAISDAEQRLLANAASALGRNLSDKDFIAELNKLKTSLAQVQSQSTSSSTSSGSGGLYDF